MPKFKLEYIWLDGYEPVPNLRGKTRSSSSNASRRSRSCRCGRSTAARPARRRETTRTACCSRSPSSRPAGRWGARDVRGAAPDGTPHPSNSRATIPDDPDTWFGFEQEYFLYEDGAPLGFPLGGGFPPPQGEYYTGVGYKNVGSVARKIVEEHLDLCLAAGIDHEGINAEVAKGQWEFQIFGRGSRRAADEMWIARYLLLRLCESYGVDVNWHCKPLGAEVDWNGSGMHTNFSTAYMREVGGKEYFEALMAAFERYLEEHIEVYGPDNHLRLTGLHETQAIDTFSWGVADRGASIRVPHGFVSNGYRGYLEDRRPNSQGDPYRIAGRILETIAMAEQPSSNGSRELTLTATAA